MGTKITGEFARTYGRDLLGRAGRNSVVTGVVGCLTIACLAGALTGAGAFGSGPNVISVDSTHKGDRLSLSPKQTSKLSPAVTTLAKPLVGCEPAFSRVVDPDRAHIFGRCVS
jgi:hypothetical protein